ncbi:MAG TPA: hypothetical protein VF098_10685 [Sphingomicrobium sp.]|jgi:hypothetical protein
MSKAIRAYVRTSAALLIGLGSVTYATSASACATDALVHSTSLQDQQSAAMLLHRADFDNRTIVGMWAFTMTPTAGPGDFGFQQWHSDGTELMNSGVRAPATENFCMGVWRQTGAGRYHLNHQALSYDAGTGQLNARVTIKEDVLVDPSGNSYSGQFSLDVYDPSGKTQVAHQQGQVTAQRVRPN